MDIGPILGVLCLAYFVLMVVGPIIPHLQFKVDDPRDYEVDPGMPCGEA